MDVRDDVARQRRAKQRANDSLEKAMARARWDAPCALSWDGGFGASQSRLEPAGSWLAGCAAGGVRFGRLGAARFNTPRDNNHGTRRRERSRAMRRMDSQHHEDDRPFSLLRAFVLATTPPRHDVGPYREGDPAGDRQNPDAANWEAAWMDLGGEG
jgi:hypothetical protein